MVITIFKNGLLNHNLFEQGLRIDITPLKWLNFSNLFLARIKILVVVKTLIRLWQNNVSVTSTIFQCLKKV